MDGGDIVNIQAINVAKPTRQPFINFVQSFRAKYDGEPRSVKELNVLAGEAWRNMSEQDKTPYRALAEAERRKPRAEKPKKISPKTMLKAQLKAMRGKMAELKGVVKRLKSQPKPVFRRKTTNPARRTLVPKKAKTNLTVRDVRGGHATSRSRGLTRHHLHSFTIPYTGAH